MANEQSITLDLRKTGFGKRVTIRQDDYHGITLAVDVTDGSKAYSVPAGAKCCLMARMLGSYIRDGGCTVEGGRIVYTADERMFGASGTAEAYFRIEVDGAAYSTEGFQLVVERSADSYAQLSEPYDTLVDDAIRRVEAAASDAKATAEAAAATANASAATADAATAKAETATSSANSAAQSAEANSTAANNAADAASKAAQQAAAAAGNAKPYYIQASEPPRDKRVNGMLWLHTDETAKTAAPKRWDANLPGKAVFPGASTMPGASTIIDEIGAWTAFTL